MGVFMVGWCSKKEGEVGCGWGWRTVLVEVFLLELCLGLVPEQPAQDLVEEALVLGCFLGRDRGRAAQVVVVVVRVTAAGGVGAAVGHY